MSNTEHPNGSFCMVCGVNTSEIHEYYMLKDEVWLRAVPGKLGMLCVDCLEGRLRRRLRPDDFDGDWLFCTPDHTRSNLLDARMNGTVPFVEREER